MRTKYSIIILLSLILLFSLSAVKSEDNPCPPGTTPYYGTGDYSTSFECCSRDEVSFLLGFPIECCPDGTTASFVTGREKGTPDATSACCKEDEDAVIKKEYPLSGFWIEYPGCCPKGEKWSVKGQTCTKCDISSHCEGNIAVNINSETCEEDRKNCGNDICIEHSSNNERYEVIFSASCEPCSFFNSLTFITKTTDFMSKQTDGHEFIVSGSGIKTENTFTSFKTPEEVFSKVSEICNTRCSGCSDYYTCNSGYCRQCNSGDYWLNGKKVCGSIGASCKEGVSCSGQKVDYCHSIEEEPIIILSRRLTLILRNHGFPGIQTFGDKSEIKVDAEYLKDNVAEKYDFSCIKKLVFGGCSVGKGDKGTAFMQTASKIFGVGDNVYASSVDMSCEFESGYDIGKLVTLKNGEKVQPKTIFYSTKNDLKFPGIIGENVYQTTVYEGNLGDVKVYIDSADMIAAVDEQYLPCTGSIINSKEFEITSETKEIKFEDFKIEILPESLQEGTTAKIRINMLQTDCSYYYANYDVSAEVPTEQDWNDANELHGEGYITDELFNRIDEKYKNQWQCINDDECFGLCTMGNPSCEWKCENHQCIIAPKEIICEGDVNSDLRVNILDLIFVRNRINQDVSLADNAKADVNQDGKINILDLVYIRERIGTDCTTGIILSPASSQWWKIIITILIIAGVIFIVWKKREI